MADNRSVIDTLRKSSLTRVAEFFSALDNYELISSEKEITDKFNDCVVWKGNINTNKESWPTYIIFSSKFPIEPPQIYSPNASKLFLENPHVMEDGFLCILPNSTSFDMNNIEDLLSYFLSSTRKILSGTSDDDFSEEFSSYWNRKITSRDIKCILISNPETMQKTFFVFRTEKVIFLASDVNSLNQWCSNKYDMKLDLNPSQNGICLDIDSPLRPSEYPSNCFDLLKLAKTRDYSVYELLTEKLIKSKESVLLLLRQRTSNGFSLGGIEFISPKLNKYIKYQDGFRAGHTPKNILINRGTDNLKESFTHRYKVIRTDYDWIHTRGGDGQNYSAKSIAIIGCGSLGSHIANTLAKSGIGHLLLIDEEKLEYENIGRHILGAQYVGFSKAKALQKYILQEMPHISIDALEGNWLDLYEKNSSIFHKCDAIIVSIANWRYERLLNNLVLNHTISPVLFSWLEPFAVAGHCFITSKSGCLNNYMNEFGQFRYVISEFTENTLKREPGGCTSYQPYGTTALLNIVTMTCRVLFKHLHKPIDSVLFSWVSDKDHFTDVGAHITSEWTDLIEENGYSRVYERNLTINDNETYNND